MAPMSLSEKLEKLTSVMNGGTIVLMLVLIILFIVMFLFSEKSKKYSYLSYGIVLSLVGFIFKDSLFPLIDMFIERMFYLFYFPTGAIYMITLVISHIVFVLTLGNKEINSIIKKINFIGFTLMQILCIHILSYLSTSNINLTNELNFVSNKTMIGLLELSMLVFTIWMVVLSLTVIIRKLTKTILSREYEMDVLPVEPVLTETINEVPYQEPAMVLETVPSPTYIEVEQPKMNDQLLERLLSPEVEEKVAKQETTTIKSNIELTLKEPQVSWSNAVVEALNIPSDPIYNDEEYFFPHLEETTIEVTQEPVMETPVVELETKNSNVTSLCKQLLRKEETSSYNLEDYLELKKYLVAQK